MNEYVRVSDVLPQKGERVLTISCFGDGDYSWSAARLTVYGWRDDQSKPVIGVTHWKRVVSPAETA